MPLEVLDPTYGEQASSFAAARRLAAIDGATIAIVSNGKKNTAPFFDAVEHELRTVYGAAEVVRLIKSNYSAPADVELLSDAARWHGLISGIGD